MYNKNVLKKSEDGNGIIVRFYNPTEEVQKVTNNAVDKLYKCKPDESVDSEYQGFAEAKKIVTVRFVK